MRIIIVIFIGMFFTPVDLSGQKSEHLEISETRKTPGHKRCTQSEYKDVGIASYVPPRKIGQNTWLVGASRDTLYLEEFKNKTLWVLSAKEYLAFGVSADTIPESVTFRHIFTMVYQSFHYGTWSIVQKKLMAYSSVSHGTIPLELSMNFVFKKNKQGSFTSSSIVLKTPEAFEDRFQFKKEFGVFQKNEMDSLRIPFFRINFRVTEGFFNKENPDVMLQKFTGAIVKNESGGSAETDLVLMAKRIDEDLLRFSNYKGILSGLLLQEALKHKILLSE